MWDLWYEWENKTNLFLKIEAMRFWGYLLLQHNLHGSDSIDSPLPNLRVIFIPSTAKWFIIYPIIPARNYLKLRPPSPSSWFDRQCLVQALLPSSKQNQHPTWPIWLLPPLSSHSPYCLQSPLSKTQTSSHTHWLQNLHLLFIFYRIKAKNLRLTPSTLTAPDQPTLTASLAI